MVAGPSDEPEVRHLQSCLASAHPIRQRDGHRRRRYRQPEPSSCSPSPTTFRRLRFWPDCLSSQESMRRRPSMKIGRPFLRIHPRSPPGGPKVRRPYMT